MTTEIRNADAIVARIQGDKDDLFGFRTEAIAEFLSFDEAKPLLKPDATPDGWPDVVRSKEAIVARMREYMAFAWEKVERHRGISAGRSVDKFGAWLWLLGDDDRLARYQATGYAPYGAPQLAFVCREFGLAVPDGEQIQRMIAGQPCEPGCNGCSE